MSRRVLLLTPSRGAGGGIERYTEALESAFADEDVWCQRVDLDGCGALAHIRMLCRARRILRSSAGPTRIVLAHRALLPMAWLLSRERFIDGISVLCHGTDVWGHRSPMRRLAENYVIRGSSVRVVAVSSFTAGSLTGHCRAGVLPPGLSRQWFDTLVDESSRQLEDRTGFHLVTAFRLGDWRDKGLPELLAGIAALGRCDVYLTVCGSGQPSAELKRLTAQYSWCTLKPGATDRELAQQFANADLLVLATRTIGGRRPSGEGFGLVLLEAQVAGTAVVGPAYGGSHDAYVDGMTGRTPVDESPAALSKVLNELLRERSGLTEMGKQAAKWARERFSPDRYSSQAVERLL